DYGGATYGKYESELASSVETTADGSFIICGTTTSFNNGLEDIYLIKTDTAGACGAFGGESMFIISVEDEAPLENSQFLLFPNPSNDMVSIMLNSPNNLQQNEITITDYLGRTIKTTQSNSFPFAISTEQLPNGMYYITLKNEEAVSTRKLVVQH
ncbi:MAG TPA: T9SS type A sorting domain-containing protein, partial [Bacteroidia bacterium]